MTASRAYAQAAEPGNFFVAGKNKIINGDFNIWQRGTSFTLSSGAAVYAADRWSTEYDGSGATRTISQQTFTPGTAPVAGYESAFFYRFNQSVAGSGGTYNLIQHRIEDVRTFANQTVTVSFWAKAASSITLPSLTWQQNFGTGGSPSAGPSTNFATNVVIGTTWQRYTFTTTAPTVTGYTIGTTTPGFLGLRFFLPLNTTFTFDLWGVQVEAGSVATPFTTATGTLAGEFQACQRYYQRYSQTGTTTQLIGNANAVNTTIVDFPFPTQVAFRSAPGSLETVNVGVYQFSNATTYTSGTWTIASAASANNIPVVRYTHGSAVFTANNTCALVTNSGASVGYIGLSAEL